jgi:serine/threonine protein kinase
MAKKVKEYETLSWGRVENPRLTRTIDEAPTALPSCRETRAHTPGPLQLTVRYVKVGRLGSGQFGEVHKAINVDSGRLMAVKILRRPARISKQDEWKTSVYYALKREVETLSSISHVSKVPSASYYMCH